MILPPGCESLLTQLCIWNTIAVAAIEAEFRLPPDAPPVNPYPPFAVVFNLLDSRNSWTPTGQLCELNASRTLWDDQPLDKLAREQPVASAFNGWLSVCARIASPNTQLAYDLAAALEDRLSNEVSRLSSRFLTDQATGVLTASPEEIAAFFNDTGVPSMAMLNSVLETIEKGLGGPLNGEIIHMSMSME